MIGGIVGAAAGAASSIFGSLGKNKMLKEMRKSIQGQMQDNQNWFDRRYNEDATQRADAQRLLTMTADRFRNRNRQDAAAQAVMGATNEAAAASKAANNQALSDTASQIAASGAARKDAVENQYMARKADLQSKLDNINSQKQSIFDIAGNAIGGAGQGFLAGMGVDDSIAERKKAKANGTA